jgi:riboflavin synthase
VHITISSSITNELKIDQSVAHNGVCLTVVAIQDDRYTVTAIDETLQNQPISLEWQMILNLERAMKSWRFDGQGCTRTSRPSRNCIRR